MGGHIHGNGRQTKMTIKRITGVVATCAGGLLLVLAAVEVVLVFYYRPTLEYRRLVVVGRESVALTEPRFVASVQAFIRSRSSNNARLLAGAASLSEQEAADGSCQACHGGRSRCSASQGVSHSMSGSPLRNRSPSPAVSSTRCRVAPSPAFR
jgi:hypothetical protein